MKQLIVTLMLIMAFVGCGASEQKDEATDVREYNPAPTENKVPDGAAYYKIRLRPRRSEIKTDAEKTAEGQ